MKKPRPRITSGPVVIACEGSILYEQSDGNVYRSLPGCLPRYYCIASQWQRSTAARRLRGELGTPRPGGCLRDTDLL